MIIETMLALLIKAFTVESPASKKETQRLRDLDPNCCLKSKEWDKEHPEGYFEWYRNYIKGVHKEYYKSLANKLNEKE